MAYFDRISWMGALETPRTGPLPVVTAAARQPAQGLVSSQVQRGIPAQSNAQVRGISPAEIRLPWWQREAGVGV